MSSLTEVAKKIEEDNQPFEVYANEEFRNVNTEIEGRFIVICPVTKRPDELWLTIKLVPNGKGEFIEYVSFYSWLLSLADEQLGIEGSCDLIFKSIEEICKPTLLEVKVETGYKVINQKAFRTNSHKYLDKK